jgi:hypothetical protein
MEERIALSHAPTFFQGAAVLTAHQYSKSLSQLNDAYTKFARHGMDYARLGGGLSKAISPIPYHRADGLLDALRGEVQQMQQNIQAGIPGSVRLALQNSRADLQSFVQFEVEAGRVVVTRR